MAQPHGRQLCPPGMGLGTQVRPRGDDEGHVGETCYEIKKIKGLSRFRCLIVYKFFIAVLLFGFADNPQIVSVLKQTTWLLFK